MVNGNTIRGRKRTVDRSQADKTQEAGRQRLPFTPKNSAGSIGPVFWLAFILVRAFPRDAQWRVPKSSGLQQRGLHRNDCFGSVTGFPFNAHPGQDARTQLANSTLKGSGVANAGDLRQEGRHRLDALAGFEVAVIDQPQIA